MHLKQAIAKLENRIARIPQIMEETHVEASAILESQLRQVAREALVAATGASTEEHMAVIDQWLGTFAAQNAGAATTFLLEKVPVAASPDELGPVTPDDVERWVRTGAERQSADDTRGKVFTEQDSDGVDRTVKKMIGILLSGNRYMTGGPTGEQVAAAERYIPLIQAFKLLEAGFTLEALRVAGPSIVMHAWVAHARKVMPGLLRKKVRQLFA